MSGGGGTRSISPTGALQAWSTPFATAGSTGVEIVGISIDGMEISIKTTNASRIVALRDHGKRVAQVDDTSMSVTAPGDAKYLRFECWGTGESFAWTQPFFVTA